LPIRSIISAYLQHASGQHVKKIIRPQLSHAVGHHFSYQTRLHPFQLDRKSSFSNAAFPALGWLFSCARAGSGIQASTHKISTTRISFGYFSVEMIPFL